jgi:ADP-heptose:LPS heptosyltransferase
VVGPFSASCSSKAGGPANKTWPLRSWNQVARAFPGLDFVFVGGQEEKDHGLLAGKVILGAPIRHIMALIARAAVYAGIDNGLTHLADAVREGPTVQIVSAVPKFWIGITESENNRVIESPNISSLAPETVIHATAECLSIHHHE